MVPKAERAGTFANLSQHTGVPLVALVETARGILAADDLASAGSVARLAFGSVDLALDLDVDETDDQALLLARSTLVLSSRAARLPAPLDGVTTDLRDAAAAGSAALRARSLGFGRKLCIHPTQVAEVAAAFHPSAAEVVWARRIRDVAGDGTAVRRVDGQMVDAPVLERALRILTRAGQR